MIKGYVDFDPQGAGVIFQPGGREHEEIMREI